MPSANDFTTGALRMLGVLEATETPPAEDLALGLERLNDWIDSLANERLTMQYVARTVYSLVASTASYTIGVGGTFNQARPLTFEGVSIIADDSASTVIETPIGLPLSVAEYQAIPDKTATGTPYHCYYDRLWSAGLGTLSFYPVPDVSTVDVVLYTPQAMTEFADAASNYTFAPGWERMIRTNLALELAPDYNAVPSPEIARIATTSLRRIKAINLQLAPLGFDVGLLQGARRTYDIRTDR